MVLGWRLPFGIFKRKCHNYSSLNSMVPTLITDPVYCTGTVYSNILQALCWCKAICVHKLLHMDSNFTGPSDKAVFTMLAGSQTRLSAQAPFPKFHPDAACAVILLKCKPQIQLCLLWLRRPSVNTQRCHNVPITAGRYFNNNLFGQLQLHH